MLRARLLVLGAMLSATAFILPFKYAARDGYGAGAALGLLISVSVWLFPPALYRFSKDSPDLRRRSFKLGWRLSLAAALGNIAQGFAFMELHAGVATVFIQTSVVFVALLGRLWLKEPFQPIFRLSLFFCLGGVVYSQLPFPTEMSQLNHGIFWGLASAFGFAMLDLLSRRYSQGADLIQSNFIRSLLAAVIISFLPGAVSQLLDFGAHRWLAISVAALLGPGIARQLLLQASKTLPALESSLLQQLRPVLALPVASLTFGIWPTHHEWWGSSLIILGVALGPVWTLCRRRWGLTEGNNKNTQ
ncbi:MAG: DMT family transporter [Polyangiaceae bacterium]|nr:DMT family transporter [Polyangiaceae bacterium]